MVKAGSTNCRHRKKRQRKTALKTVLLVPKLQEFNFFTLRILHLVYLPKFCISIVFTFSWDNCDTQEKWKTMVKQFILGEGGWQRGYTRSTISNVKIVNVIFYCVAFSSTFVMNGRQSDTLRDFKSFIQANNYLFIPNWYLISWALNCTKLKTSRNKSSQN